MPAGNGKTATLANGRRSEQPRLLFGPPSFFGPIATTVSAPSSGGRRSSSASADDTENHQSISSAVRRITGIDFGCTGFTSALRPVVRKA